ncbi:hypothetical protein BGZ81_007204 [Podila clonocystis]|nr:hypothetical protein BGZ81_007204 [Podila clonocystis]
MHPTSRLRAKLLVPRLCILILSTYIVPAVQGQAYTPATTYNSASVFIEGKAMFIQSGMTFAGRTQQAFSIDLSKSWNVASPLYTKMKDGFFSVAMPNTLLADGESWFLVANSTHSATYNVRTEAITYKASTMAFNISPGLKAVADPANDNIIIPNGALTPASATALLYGHSDTFTLTLALLDVPAYGYSIAWSASAKTAFVFGGQVGTSLSNFFGRWVNTGNYTWERISSTGLNPVGREMGCMVPAYNGAKLVLFGGRTTTGSLNDIWVYDVLASKWEEGSPGGPKRSRSGHACAVSGDYLIVWGGVLMAIETPGDYTSLYNLVTNTWVDQYVPPVPPKATTTRPGTGPTLTSDGTSSPTATTLTPESTPQSPRSSFERIGIPIIAAAAGVILVGLLFLLYRWKKAKGNVDRSIPLDHADDKNSRSLPPIPDDASHHFQKTAFYDDIKRQPQQHQQYPIPYTTAHVDESSPGSTHRQPQGNEVQAQEQMLQEYESRWQRQLEEQRELEQRIEQQRADLQMMKRGQQNWDRSTPEDTLQTERRGPQYWSMGSSGDKELPDHGWTLPQQPRGVQAYYPSR